MMAATLRPMAAAVVMPKKEIHIGYLHWGSEAENAQTRGKVPANIDYHTT
jgi:hypothetical protein